MELKEVTLEATTGGYRTEFFAAVAKQPVGKFFKYEENVPETTVRSAAAVEGRRLNRRFSVRTVRTPDGPYFAVGRIPAEKQRTPQIRLTRETRDNTQDDIETAETNNN